MLTYADTTTRAGALELDHESGRVCRLDEWGEAERLGRVDDLGVDAVPAAEWPDLLRLLSAWRDLEADREAGRRDGWSGDLTDYHHDRGCHR